MKTKMFKLVAADGGVVNTAEFHKFDDNPEKGRAMAEKYIKNQKARWEAQPMFEGETLRIVEV